MGYFQQLPFSLLLSAWLNSSLATIVAARQTSHWGRQQKGKGKLLEISPFLCDSFAE
ncbi:MULTISPECIES: hypothetical protein [Eisenbergiella]|uniref:hypothetical protein n=1 Tax=Eisenbergiella TaxID=1432051 RepID=UPI0023F01205|nr:MULTISPECIES: hypothetical protein [Eisenbergiella]MCI6710019.1 hypothetical protein [Eisenbergiella massiliensis]MDY5526840.1 hypothetical protein [Eisenbergiella porci]